MLVDVREFSKKAQAIVNGTFTVIRLIALNESNRLCGNARKSSLEYTIRSREIIKLKRISPRGDSNADGKHALLKQASCTGTVSARLRRMA